MACSTATISTSPARASTMARGGSRPSGTRASPRLISTMIGLYAFGRQPEAIHWDVVAARRLPRADQPTPRRWPICSPAGRRGSKRRWSSGWLARLGVASRGGDEDRGLAVGAAQGAALARRRHRRDFLRLARRARRRRTTVYRDPAFDALARRARRPPAAADPRLLGRPGPLLDADRRGRGDLGRRSRHATTGPCSRQKSPQIRRMGDAMTSDAA